jgi:hypothetical protein
MYFYVFLPLGHADECSQADTALAVPGKFSPARRMPPIGFRMDTRKRFDA